VIVPNNHWSTCKNITAICTVNFYVEKYRRNTEQWRLETKGCYCQSKHQSTGHQCLAMLPVRGPIASTIKKIIRLKI
jgi:hypothetical protein